MRSDYKNSQATRDIMSLFLRIVNKYNAMEKIPVQHGKNPELYHSERHMLDKIAGNSELNISEHAAALGVTKGAISQIARKLEKKGLALRVKGVNEKEVRLELTQRGKAVIEKRRRLNDETLLPLEDELRRHSDKEVEFLVYMLKWLDRFFDESKAQMETRSRKR